MPKASVISEPLVAWGVASRALPGQAVSGDLHVVRPVSYGVLVAVLDGVGHGQEAATVARKAAAILESHAEEPPVALIQRCHLALSHTRGVVMTVASLNASTSKLAWLGVGNVEALLLRANANVKPATERVILRSGLVGYHLPELCTGVVPIAPGDLLVFVTDGIDCGFARRWAHNDPPEEIANRVMEEHFKRTDDALVLVLRYLGTRDE